MSRDQYGYGVEQLNEAQYTAKKMAKDHLYVWNRLIENKGPIGIQKDQQNPNPRLRELLGHEGFMNFMESKSMEGKMTALRDAGITGSASMKDEELAQFLMTHIPVGLTEDPKVHEEAKRRTFGDYAKQTTGAVIGGALGGALGANVGGIPIGAAVGAHITRPDKEKIF